MKKLKKLAVRIAAAFVLLTTAAIAVETLTGANKAMASDPLCGVFDSACVTYLQQHGYNSPAVVSYSGCNRNCSATNSPKGTHPVVYVSEGIITGSNDVPN